MTDTTRDLSAALDEMEDRLELQRSEPDTLLSELATLRLGFPRDSFHRARAHRMLGVVYGRMGQHAKALAELQEARVLASSLSPPNYRELGNIAREMSSYYEARGEDGQARDELVAALAFCAIGGDEHELARLIVKVGSEELEAHRPDKSALLFGALLSGNRAQKVRQHTANSARLGLIHALNALGQHGDVPAKVKESHGTLNEEDSRLRFLTQLEAARALAGLGRHDDAEGAMLIAENFLPDSETARDHAEFIQAVMELQEWRNGDNAVDSLDLLITQCIAENDLAREAVARRALANVLFKRGEDTPALETLGRALDAASQGGLDIADELRAALLRRAGAARLIDLSEAPDLLEHAGEERRYIKLRPLGHGNAGESVLAVALADGALVSLRARNLSALDQEAREQAAGAIKMAYGGAARLKDPRLAPLRDVCLTQAGTLYSVQERPDGPTLREFYLSNTEPSHMAELLASLAEGLNALHGHDVVHRDLRPDHVVVTRDDEGHARPVLIELGMAAIQGLTGAEAAGMPPYVAPEQVAGDPGDKSADIHALGQMIVEVWGGKVPSRANFGRLWKRDGENQMPHAIGDLVRQMTTTNPARRMADLDAITEALRTHRGDKV